MTNIRMCWCIGVTSAGYENDGCLLQGLYETQQYANCANFGGGHVESGGASSNH